MRGPVREYVCCVCVARVRRRVVGVGGGVVRQRVSVPVASQARAAGPGGALRFYSDRRMGGLIIMETDHEGKDSTGRCGGTGCTPVPASAPFLLGMC
jgi:hypothetical protein